MKYVVKLGGAGLETPSLLEGCTRAIAELARDGHQVAVVHGGGLQLTRMLKALGKQSQFIDGLRVTDAETRDVALMVLAGKVNKQLVAGLGALGVPAMGLSGGDGLIFRARKKRTTPDLGYVGEIAASKIIFTPHLLPIPRGILSTIYMHFREPQTKAGIAQVYEKFFTGSPMVRLYDKALPQIQYSVRTCYADIGFQLADDGRRAVVVSCLDNLLKGASGQAVQNLNVMLDWPESEGLE